MVSVKKSKIFSGVLFSKVGLEIMLSYGLEIKEGFDKDENVNFLKFKKWVFTKGGKPWSRSKNQKFFLVCFSSKAGLEIMLSYGLERK